MPHGVAPDDLPAPAPLRRRPARPLGAPGSLKRTRGSRPTTDAQGRQLSRSIPSSFALSRVAVNQEPHDQGILPPVSSASLLQRNRDGTDKEEACRQENHFCETSQKDGKRQKAPQVGRHPATEGRDFNASASRDLTARARSLSRPLRLGPSGVAQMRSAPPRASPPTARYASCASPASTPSACDTGRHSGFIALTVSRPLLDDDFSV